MADVEATVTEKPTKPATSPSGPPATPPQDPKGPASCPDGLPDNVKVSFTIRAGNLNVSGGYGHAVPSESQHGGTSGGPRR